MYQISLGWIWAWSGQGTEPLNILGVLFLLTYTIHVHISWVLNKQSRTYLNQNMLIIAFECLQRFVLLLLSSSW